jgi:hypothetical protein
MLPIPHIERHGDIGISRPQDNVTLSDGVGMITLAVAEARRLGLTGLVLVAHGLAGFPPPGVVARHAMMRECAKAAGGVVKLAMVVTPEFIDPEKFGVVVAHNYGLVAEVFTSEAEALDWLRRPA